jgi:hypothetical protein
MGKGTPNAERQTLRSGLNQGLLLLDQLLPNLPMSWLVSVVLKFGHFAAQNDQLFQ